MTNNIKKILTLSLFKPLTQSMKTKIHSSTEIKDLPFPVAFVDKRFEIKQYSDVFHDYFDFKVTDTLPKYLQGLIGELPKSFLALKKRKSSQKIPLSEFISYVSRKGELRWHKLTLYECKSGKGYYLYFEDVTKKKIAFDLSLQAEHTAKIGSWEVDLVNNQIYWSDMTKEIHEVSEDFVPDLEGGINFYKKGEHRDRIVELVSNAIENGVSFDEEFIIVTAKGNEKWVRSICSVEMVNGKATRIFGVFQDIDKAKSESLKYQVLTDRMRVAVQSSNIGIWDYDIVNNVLVWDDNMYELYQVKKENFSGEVEAWESTIHPDDREKSLKAVQEAVEGKKEFNTEFRIKTADGSVRYIHGLGKVFRNQKGEAIRMVGANTDVSRIKKADSRLRQLLNTTEKQNQSLLNFAHIVSHNLRSNSSNLSMLTGMLLENTEPKKQQRFLEMIRLSSERLDETVVQLNEVIKIQTDHNLNYQWVPVKQTLTKVLESINAHIEEIDPKINIQIPDELKVYGVKAYIGSIFLNLLTNSLKYRKQEMKLQIDIESKENEENTVISFKDNGRGIDLKRHGDKLFGMYKTFHGNKDAKGVGLFISKNQMDTMNAEIEVESEVDKGAAFHLYFSNKKKN
ncbi:PAS domain S-box protein [Flagellimonas allohymeniacidonis]|uniref:histidine kinase n=2 Tax=Flagellimonas allohymeniacidonis TaxID=2517819 RepID=A0A4Q8QBG9_9FLAO|nr:PAS domain S-box protein [Allomuricauda hymeniacidonis]